MSYDYIPKDEDESKTVNDFVKVAEVKATCNMSCISFQTADKMSIILSPVPKHTQYMLLSAY